METFAICDLNFIYPGQGTKAVNSFSLNIRQGEFLVVFGPSGCGKSTLLRHLKPVLAPHGHREGAIFFEGCDLEGVDQRTQSEKIGFIGQSPDDQLVTDKVWHELAFGLESLGYDTPTIRRRVAEMASFFGIEGWFYQETNRLSGGQKQLLNLASVMVMQPSVLILDEPTSQLDPIAASDFLGVLGRINRELGTTVILAEHRLEEAFDLATIVAVMDRGRLVCSGTPGQIGSELKARGHSMFLAMPTPMRVWGAVDSHAPCPVTIREGKDWLGNYAAGHSLNELSAETEFAYPDEMTIEVKGLWYRYKKDMPDAVKGLDLRVKKGEFLALLGGNGTGKTTTLKLIAGLLTPYRGKVHTVGTIGMLPQNPQILFGKKTVQADLAQMTGDEEQLADVARLCCLEGLLERHPYDLSGGEQQRAALAKILLLSPDILLLDEPTKGLDAEFKQTLGEILNQLLCRGVAVLMVSHDVEFCARYAHRCALLFDGAIVTQGTPRTFFAGNRFYTTAANRMARTVLPEAVTAEEVIAACGGELPAVSQPPAEPPQTSCHRQEHRSTVKPDKRHTGSVLTKAVMALSLLLIPLTLYLGQSVFGGRRYSLVALLVLLEGMLPFFLAFEGRRPWARELVILAVICALGVAGRAAFFMLPEFKPVMALTIIAGVAFGGQSGFLTGAVTMFVSNMMFAQGPWTPWQMFAMGLVGACAGVMFRPGRIPSDRFALCFYGALAAIIIYGGIMNPASAILWTGNINWKIILTYCLSGLPMDCVQAAATGLFLWLAAEPMLEKLARVKQKYGLL